MNILVVGSIAWKRPDGGCLDNHLSLGYVVVYNNMTGR